MVDGDSIIIGLILLGVGLGFGFMFSRAAPRTQLAPPQNPVAYSNDEKWHVTENDDGSFDISVKRDAKVG